MTLARAFADLLAAVGIRRVYGLPGEDHMTLLDAVQAAGLEYHTAFNETSAVLMAATDSDLTGLPGVAMLSMAPGVSNAINGILNAYLEQQPVIVISGAHPAARAPFVVRQGFETQRLVEPITKWQARVTADTDIAALVGKTIEEAMVGRPGPVYLEFPDAAATAEAGGGVEAESVAQRLIGRRGTLMHPNECRGEPSAVADLGSRLARAQRPVLIVGGRRRRLEPATAASFAQTLRVPVLTSTRQKGLLAPDHPFWAGTFLNGRLEAELLGRADLVVMIDPEAFDFYNRSWSFDAETVAVVAPDFTDWANPFSTCLVAAPDSLLGELTTAAAPGASQWQADEIVAYNTRLRESLLGSAGEALSVPEAVDVALGAWPADGWLVADAGFTKPLVAMLSRPSRPERFLASNALSTMGFSIPAALAVARADAGPVLAFLGDGSLLMRATELAAAPELPGPLVVVATLDRSLTQIAVKQERRELATVGAELPPISCAALGPALGIDGVDAATAEELRDAVTIGLRSGRPRLVGALVDPGPSRPVFEVMRG
jgi:acetolactate synthase-1/2/3 large subunit